jgi:hypothetical protein
MRKGVKDKYEYRNNSIFYYFYKSPQKIELDYKQISLLKEIPTFYQSIICKLKSINITTSFYICPSGFYGQFIYFNLNEDSKKNVKGFLDGDSFKISKRLSGTPLYI